MGNNMTEITKKILESDLPTVFTNKDLVLLYPDTTARYYQVSRAIRNGEIIRLRRNFYTLNNTYRKNPIDTYALSHRIDNSSYVSFVAALRKNNWIPEAVFVCTCVTQKKSRLVDCTLFGFDYQYIKQVDYSKGVQKVNYYGEDFFQATPLKALCDYISWRKLDWTSSEPLLESLRIEEENLMELTTKDFDELQGNYPAYPNTELFLSSLRKELGL